MGSGGDGGCCRMGRSLTGASSRPHLSGSETGWTGGCCPARGHVPAQPEVAADGQGVPVARLVGVGWGGPVGGAGMFRAWGCAPDPAWLPQPAPGPAHRDSGPPVSSAPASTWVMGREGVLLPAPHAPQRPSPTVPGSTLWPAPAPSDLELPQAPAQQRDSVARRRPPRCPEAPASPLPRCRVCDRGSASACSVSGSRGAAPPLPAPGCPRRLPAPLVSTLTNSRLACRGRLIRYANDQETC